MRLICPNCDAEYEVDGSLLPAQGREVQCSNCGQTWFQHPMSDEDDSDAFSTGPDLAVQRPATNPKALDILHEEVERETRARAAEANALETQGDLGLQAPPPGPARAKATLEPPEQLDADKPDQANDETFEITHSGRGESTKRELLPDIEEINSTLASAPEPQPEDEEAEEAALPNRRSRFRTGFGLMLILSAAIVGAYVYAPELAERFPQTGDAMMGYVSFIDKLRVSLDGGAQALLEQLTALTERIGS